MYVEIKIMMFGPLTLIPLRGHISSLDEKEKKILGNTCVVISHENDL